MDCAPEEAMAVTRSQASRDVIHPLKVPDPSILNLSPVEFKLKQLNCHTLKSCWDKASKGETARLKDGSLFKFVIIEELLYRKCFKVSKRLDCRQIISGIAIRM